MTTPTSAAPTADFNDAGDDTWFAGAAGPSTSDLLRTQDARTDGAHGGVFADPGHMDVHGNPALGDGAVGGADGNLFDPVEDLDHGRPDYDEDHELDAVPNKKPSKAKTYLMLGGVAVAMVVVIGGGLAVKMHKRSAASQAESMSSLPDRVESVPTRAKPAVQAPAQPARQQQVAQPQAVQQQAVQQPAVPQARADATTVSLSPAQGAAPMSAVAQVAPPAPAQPQAGRNQEPQYSAAPNGPATANVPTPMNATTTPSMPPADSTGQAPVAKFDELQKKSDMLAQAIVKTKADGDAAMQAVKQDQGVTHAELDDHGKRLAEMEIEIKSLQDLVEELRPHPKTTAKTSAAKQVASVRKPEPAKHDTTHYPKMAAKTEAPLAPSNQKGLNSSGGVSRYRVVATYPATPGTPAQKAWVTNGERLQEVTVGSQVEGAKVTSINGLTVSTTGGVIRAVK